MYARMTDAVFSGRKVSEVPSPIVNIIASFQATEAIKLLTGRLDKVNRDLLFFDVWENVQRRIRIAPLLGTVDCPCCRRR